MAPFEFIVLGPPLSLQTKNRQRLQEWKARVRLAAAKRWKRRKRTTPLTGSVSIEICYYYDREPPDVDNIIKPIQDALAGLLFVNDKQVVDAAARKRNINHAFRVRGMSPVLASGFVAGEDFIHVKVSAKRDLKDVK